MELNNYPILSIFYVLSIALGILISKIYKKFGSKLGITLITIYLLSSFSFIRFYLVNNDNYFKLFNLNKNFTPKELSTNYKNLSKLHHPDLNPNSDSTYFLYLTNLKEVMDELATNKGFLDIYNYFGDKEDIFELYFEKSSSKNFNYYFKYYSEKFWMEYVIIIFMTFMILKELEVRTTKIKIVIGLCSIFGIFEIFLFDFYNFPKYSIYFKNFIDFISFFNQITYYEISMVLKILTIVYVNIILIFQNIYFVSDLEKLKKLSNEINSKNENDNLNAITVISKKYKNDLLDKRKEFRYMIVLIVIMIVSSNYNGFN